MMRFFTELKYQKNSLILKLSIFESYFPLKKRIVSVTYHILVDSNNESLPESTKLSDIYLAKLAYYFLKLLIKNKISLR